MDGRLLVVGLPQQLCILDVRACVMHRTTCRLLWTAPMQPAPHHPPFYLRHPLRTREQASNEFETRATIPLYYEPRALAVALEPAGLERAQSLQVSPTGPSQTVRSQRYWVAVASPNGIDLHKIATNGKRVYVAHEVGGRIG